MNLDDGLERIDAHAVEDRVAQDTGVVDHAVELAKTVDGHLDDPARRDRLGNRLEIRPRRAPALTDFLDDFFGRRGAVARTVGRTAGIVDNDLGAFGRAEQGDFTP